MLDFLSGDVGHNFRQVIQALLHPPVGIFHETPTGLATHLYACHTGLSIFFAVFLNAQFQQFVHLGLLKVQQQYVRKFRKILPIRKAARFFQLENKIDAEIDAELAMTVPLIE